ncbi:MAG: EAL domain-containing protein [Proteobacteria bacterium]|nr:EAL domain-containing protein [Pseudomonadota bacterium]
MSTARSEPGNGNGGARAVHVLLAEDVPADADLVIDNLVEEEGGKFEVDHKSRLSDAISALRPERRVDVVLLDLGLPDAQGLQTLWAVLARAGFIPVIVLTGLKDRELGIQAVRSGAQDYLTKGATDRTVLVQSIRHAIERAAKTRNLAIEIEERKRVERALRESQERTESIAANLPGVIFRRILSPDGRVSYPYVSPRVSEYLNLTADEIAADPGKLFSLVHPDDLALFREVVNRSAAQLSALDFTVRVGFPGGSRRWIRGLSHPRRMEGGEIVWDGIWLDVTAQKEAEEQRDYLSSHDSLTGLSNRSLFGDRLARALVRAERRGEMLAVGFLDVDRFRMINDTLGHGAGDLVVKGLAERLSRAIGVEDILARWGADVFSFALTDVRHHQDAPIRVQDLIDQCREPFEVGEKSMRISVTLGISLFPEDGDDADSLLRHADIALKRGKSESPGSYAYFRPEMRDVAARLLATEEGLRRAIEGDAIVVAFQPQMGAKRGELLGFEALVRWRDPERGIVSPGDFIQVAEETGLIGPLGEVVIDKACEALNRWRQEGLSCPPVSVNLSARQLAAPGLARFVEGAVRKHALAGRFLKFEVTEGTIFRDYDTARDAMRQIADAGSQFLLDDFGTGYSSLVHLKHLPIEGLKIDQTFIRDVLVSASDAEIVKAVIGMAKALGKYVVAEGVETGEQLDFLRENSCDAAQGYLFARPMEFEAATAFLRAAHPG